MRCADSLNYSVFSGVRSGGLTKRITGPPFERNSYASIERTIEEFSFRAETGLCHCWDSILSRPNDCESLTDQRYGTFAQITQAERAFCQQSSDLFCRCHYFSTHLLRR